MAVRKIYANLDVTGTGSFTGVVSGADGVAPGDFTTKSQVEGLGYLTALVDDIAPTLAGSLDAATFSIINLGAITATGNIATTGTVSGSNISGINTGDQDLSGLLPLTAGNGSPLTGAIYGGENVEVADKARHTVLWGVDLRKQYSHWNGSGWVAMSGMGIGENALLNNSGYHSNGIGYNALNNNSGNYSNGIGYNALASNTGANVVGIGHNAAQNNTGADSVGIGYLTLLNNTGYSSTGVGHQALHSNSGAGSVGIGANALYYNDGAYNTAIGDNAFADDHTGSGITNTTIIGANAEPDASNQVKLGDTGITRITAGNLAYTPVEDNDLANKAYVDNLDVDFGGYQKKEPTTWLDSLYRGGDYVDKGTEEVFFSAVNDVIAGGFHGLQYIEKYDSLYAVARGANTLLYKFTDMNDLSVYTTTDLSVANYGGGTENIVYDDVKDKLYIVMGDVDYSQYDIVVWEIDPITLVSSIVITHTSTVLVGAPPFIALNGFLYVANNYYSAIMYKFDLSDYTLDDSLAFGHATNGPHAMMTDGEKIFVTAVWEWGSGIQVARLTKDTLFVEESVQMPLVGLENGRAGFTDDGILIGDYIYIGTENQSPNTMYKVKKSDLTDYVDLNIQIQPNTELWAVAYDNNLMWYTGSEGTLGSLDINSHENVLYENPFTNSINELVFNGKQFLTTGFDVYPVVDTAYVGRTGAPFKPISTISLDSDGTVIGTDFASLSAAQSFTGVNTFDEPVTVAEPVAPTDAATKLYVDTNSGGTIPAGNWLVQKADGNTDLDNLEIGDFVRGQRGPIFWESARYDGGDEAEDTSFTVYNSFNI